MGVAAGREDGSRGRRCSWYPGDVWRVGRRRNPYRGCVGEMLLPAILQKGARCHNRRQCLIYYHSTLLNTTSTQAVARTTAAAATIQLVTWICSTFVIFFILLVSHDAARRRTLFINYEEIG